MPYAVNDGIRLYYEVRGDGPAMLFLHEYAGDHRSWEAQIEHFAHSYRCITVSARGYPPSDEPDDPQAYSQAHANRDALAVLDDAGAQRAHIVGISMGAYTGLQLAMQAPGRCLSLAALSSGSGSYPPTRKRFIADCHALADLIEAEGAIPAAEMGMGPTRVQLHAKDRDAWQQSVDHMAEHAVRAAALTLRGVQAGRAPLTDFEDELAAISIPVLLVVGDEDESCLDINLYLKRIMAASQLLVLPGSGHPLNLEEPGLVNTFLGRFLASIEDGSWHPRDPAAMPQPGGAATSIGLARA